MKLYLLTVFLVLFTASLMVYGQSNPNRNSSVELPSVKKESLAREIEIEIYPNPADDFLSITLKNTNVKNLQFDVFNIIGNKMDFDYEDAGTGNYKLRIRDLPPGYYLVLVKDPLSKLNKAYKFRKL